MTGTRSSPATPVDSRAWCARSATRHFRARRILSLARSRGGSRMPLRPVHALVVATGLASMLAACAAPTSAQSDAIRWRENAAGSAAPELVKFNELLADLAERLQPGLVHVRVTRAVKEESEEPGEGRRSSGSGF